MVMYVLCRKLCFATLVIAILAAPLAAQQPAPPTSPAVPGRRELAPTNDPKEIVRRSVEIDRHNFELSRGYTWQERTVTRYLGKDGEAKRQEIQTHDVNYFYGKQYSRMVMEDDKPLSGKKEKKEEEEMDKFISKYKNESEEDRRKRLVKEEKERQEARAFVHDVVNAYDFRLAGEEQLDGRDAYVIEATPRRDFHPTQPHADILAKVRGKIWIDKAEYAWIKAEAETIDTISFGLFLARIHKGSRMSFEQAYVNHEVWLLRRLSINGSARIAVFANPSIEEENTYSNFKKFTADAHILPGAVEVQPAPAKSSPPQ